MWITNNLLSILLLSLGATHIAVYGATLRCYRGDFEIYSEFCLDDPTSFLNSTYYRGDRGTIFFASGYGFKTTGGAVDDIISACLDLDFNCCLLNWEKEAAIGLLGDLGFPVAANNAKTVGEDFCGTIKKLVETGRFNLTGSRFIGFSLGAPLLGYTGRKCKNDYNITLPIIFGLDPVKALHSCRRTSIIPKIPPYPQLQSTDADFVLHLKTNFGKIGTDENCGHVNMWVNCNNPVQPGCANATDDTGFLILRSPQDMCSHNRSWLLFGKAMKDDDLFIGRKADSCDGWYKTQGATFNLEINPNTSARGEYYFRTTDMDPYGLRLDGAAPSN